MFGTAIKGVPVGIATSWTVRVSNLSRGNRYFSSTKCKNQLGGLSSLLCSAYRGSFLGVNQPWHGGNHSPPSHTKVKIEWSQNSLLLYSFIALARTVWLYLYSNRSWLCVSLQLWVACHIKTYVLAASRQIITTTTTSSSSTSSHWQ